MSDSRTQEMPLEVDATHWQREATVAPEDWPDQGKGHQKVHSNLTAANSLHEGEAPPDSFRHSSLQSERQLEQRAREQSSNIYDQQLLSRIGGPNAPKHYSVPPFSHLATVTPYERRQAGTMMMNSPFESQKPPEPSPQLWSGYHGVEVSQLRPPCPPIVSEPQYHAGAKRRASSPLPPIHQGRRSPRARDGSKLPVRQDWSGGPSAPLAILSAHPLASFGAGHASSAATGEKTHQGLPEKQPLAGFRQYTQPQQGLALCCKCCPKKPQRFLTADELRAHEAQKPFACGFCSHRFKNRNEAERHQNSLHLRKHSWSCEAMAGPESAFWPSPAAAHNDLCGFCGKEFPLPPQWDVRTEHLNRKHKFKECNLGKKFFRADHFRQHLKHSHAGVNGKWTSVLENACVREETGVALY